jgi:hypothetical protein
MSWNIRLIEYGKEVTGATLRIGDAFFYDKAAAEQERLNETHTDYDRRQSVGWYWPRAFARDERLSEQYHNVTSKERPPLLVFLPGTCLFCVDGMCWSDGNYYGGWQVTGTPPLITVDPSINLQGIYHGWIQNGVISDDCEGRQYDETGRRK